MAITSKTRKVLWGRSGNRCAICKTELVLEKDIFNRNLNLGEECHIISRQEGGPRNQIIKNFDYDAVNNLILLCCNHHRMIDEQVEENPVDELIRIKDSHEEWVTLNLSSDQSPSSKEESLIDSLVKYVSSKHDREMNLDSCSSIFSSAEGLKLAFLEAANVKSILKDTVDKISNRVPNYNIIQRDNQQHITDILFKGKTLLAQFYQAYANVADDCYLLFAIVNGYFNKDGYADPFYPVTMIEIIRLNFSYNDKGEFGWRDQLNKDEFYKSQEITEIWINKFFLEALKEEE